MKYINKIAELNSELPDGAEKDKEVRELFNGPRRRIL